MGDTIDLLHDESRRAPQARRLDALCDRFEAAWAAGQRPRIEEELADSPESERPALLRRLLVLELEVRQRQSEQPTPREYQERFPGYVALVEEVFAEAAIPHDWRAPGAGARAAPPVHTPPPGKSADGTLGIRDFVKSASDSRVAPAPGQMPGEEAGSPEDLRTPVEEVFAEATTPRGWRAHKAVAKTAPPVHTPPPPGKSADGTLGIQDFVKSASDSWVAPARARWWASGPNRRRTSARPWGQTSRGRLEGAISLRRSLPRRHPTS